MAHTKQTIAIIGIKNNFGVTFANKLCKGNFRVVMFDENPDEARFIKESIFENNLKADIDVVECKHMATWEADIIVIAVDERELGNAAKRIVDVSTQKVVAILSDAATEERLDDFERMFPHSKVSILVPCEKKEEITLYFRDERAVQELQEMITLSGYKVNIVAAT